MNTVNLFFACDDAYVPFLAVTLTSVKQHRAPNRHYAVRVLHTGISEAGCSRIGKLEEEGFTIGFYNISHRMETLSHRLHTRDYYSASTYYRLFIPELFPELKKALYLDCDLVLETDVAQLYDVELGTNLVGAVPDGMVGSIAEMALYVRNRLGFENPEKYFNAGVLLMNLEAMRAEGFTGIFLELLGRVKFQVAQDQDYLNVICRDRVTYLGYEWNTMPSGIQAAQPKLIHYNLDGKPWHKDGMAYEEIFWDYAARSGCLTQIRSIKRNYTCEQREAAAKQTLDLIGMCVKQAMDSRENAHIHRQIRRVVCC